MINLDKNASPTATRYGVVLAAVLLGSLLVGCRETSADRSTDAASETTVQMSDDELRDLIDEVLDFTENQRELSSDRHATWPRACNAPAISRFHVELRTRSAVHLFARSTWRANAFG